MSHNFLVYVHSSIADAKLSSDDKYTLWLNGLNGKVVGSGSGLGAADAWSIPGLEPTFNVFAINATNTISGHGAVIGTILVTYSDGTNATLVTDASWLVSADVSDGFADTFADEGSFTAATYCGCQVWCSELACVCHTACLISVVARNEVD